jgi:predicted HAD superfamily hydrolase
MSYKNVLFFVEPWAELTPDFRFGAFADAVYQIHMLKAHAPEIECRIMMGDGVREKAIQDGYVFHQDIDTLVLSSTDLRDSFRDYRDAARAFMTDSATEEQLDALAALCKRSLGDFVPDVIMMHETHAPYLRRAFPEALVLHTMYGMTYRMPYPRMTLLDPLGLYQKSTLSVHADEIRGAVLSTEQSKSLARARNWFAMQMVAHDPAWPLIEPHQSRHERLLLVPLQVNGYYAFDECSSYKTQIDFLEDVLQRTPKSWGVVVTEHSEYTPALDALTLARLRRLYPNLIVDPRLNAIPYVSQALLPHVDAIVSVSSSLAFQSLIYDVPVIAAGTSHINSVATCGIDELPRVFDLHVPNSRDSILHFFLTRYHWSTNHHMHDGAGLYALIGLFHQAHQEGKVGLDALPEARDLDEVIEELSKVSQWRAWNEDLKKRDIPISPNPVLRDISFGEMVSFDLFDTLVDRPFLHPHELFQFLEPMVRKLTGNIYFPFHHLRREAERKAREANGHRIEVTLDEIYQQLELLTAFPQSMLDEIKQMELQAEYTMINPRRGMVRAWRLAKIWGKTRSILTDIYLEQDFIETVLRKCGYGDYDLLFVSATERIRKEDGTVYPDYMAAARQLEPRATKFVHIGDNPRADGEMARKYGISTVIIPKATDLLKKSEFGNVMSNAFASPSFDSSMIIGMMANRFFSAPTSNFAPGTLCDGNLFNVGYTLLGPFALGYVQWVVRRMMAHNVDHAYFLARDGYLVMKVYEALKPYIDDLPSHSYLYCSRRSVNVPGIESKRDIYEIATLNYGTTTVKNFLRSRFGLEADELPPKLLKKHGIKPDGSTMIGYPRDLALTIKLVNDIEPFIMEKARSEREGYMAYLKREGVCDTSRKLAFVDIGYSGTMQRKISQMTGVPYYGYYMLTHNYVLHHFRHQVFEAWLEEYDSQRAAYKHPFNMYIPLIESLLSSTEGSFVCFDKKDDGEHEAQWLYVSNEKERCAFVEGLHEGAMAFVTDYLKMFGAYGIDFEFSPQVASYLLFRFGAQPNPTDVKVFEGLILENMFAGSEFSIIASPHHLLDQRGKLSQASLDRLMSESKWKQGAQVAYQKYLESAPAQQQPTKPAAIIAPPASPSLGTPEAGPAATRVDGGGDAEHMLGDSPTLMSQLSRSERLRRKLKNDPQRFFSESRNPAVRQLRHLFGNNAIGKVSTSLIRIVV